MIGTNWDITGQKNTEAEIERQALLQSLTRHTGSRNLAAEELGLSTRTIQRKIKEYKIETP